MYARNGCPAARANEAMAADLARDVAAMARALPRNDGKSDEKLSHEAQTYYDPAAQTFAREWNQLKYDFDDFMGEVSDSNRFELEALWEEHGQFDARLQQHIAGRVLHGLDARFRVIRHRD